MTTTTMFEGQLQRLKECLGLKEDQDVAKALGMSKAAFSYRKKTNAFPEERLVGLKPSHPDLDIGYVLHGERWAAEDRDDFDLLAAMAVALGTTPTDLAKKAATRINDNPTSRLLYDAMNSALVKSLLEILQWCDDESIEVLVQAAAKMRGSQLVPFSQRRSAAEAPTNTSPEKVRPTARRSSKRAA